MTQQEIFVARSSELKERDRKIVPTEAPKLGCTAPTGNCTPTKICVLIREVPPVKGF